MTASDPVAPAERVRDDFNRIAGLPDQGYDPGESYLDGLLARLPVPCPEALEIGCGAGALTARLAERCGRVLAVDLSPRMIDVARGRIAGARVALVVGDALERPWGTRRFDAVVSVATLHHLPLAAGLALMRDALRPGGTLLVLDLHRIATPLDLAATVPAGLVMRWARWRRTGRPWPSAEARDAWAAHARHDRMPSLAEVRSACRDELPGATVTRHLLWRYTVAWTHPS